MSLLSLRAMLHYLKPKSVYVKVFENRFVLKLLEEGEVPVTMVPAKPFTTKRLLVGNFTLAEEALREGLKKVIAGHWFASHPAMVIHPMEMVDGGLSQVEGRVLRELGVGAGARSVSIWVGHELSDEEAKIRMVGGG